MRRLLPDPDPGPLDVGALVAGLELAACAPADRPYTIANLVQSADGRATFDGRSTALGDDGDRQVFRALRSVCDVVLVGTGTLAAEHYGRLVRDGALQAAREARGLPVQPLLCTVTRSGRVSREIPLLADPDARLLVYSGVPIDIGEVAASVQVVTVDADRLTIAPVLGDLRTRHSARLVLCEGGPTLFAQLLAQRVVDELFLTLAARLAGGDGPTVVSGLALSEPLALSLRWLLEQDGSLFARYALPT